MLHVVLCILVSVLYFISGSIVTIWFIIGGGINLHELIVSLKAVRRNDLDDGMVVDHHNLDEQTPEQSPIAQENQPVQKS